MGYDVSRCLYASLCLAPFAARAALPRWWDMYFSVVVRYAPTLPTTPWPPACSTTPCPTTRCCFGLPAATWTLCRGRCRTRRLGSRPPNTTPATPLSTAHATTHPIARPYPPHPHPPQPPCLYTFLGGGVVPALPA